jgi:predicted alpha/beta-hydrolase family hydrolase
VSTRRRAPGTLLLFPGAGADRNQATLQAIERAVAWSTVRADFPYRLAGRRSPDRPPVLMAAVRDELAAIRTKRVVVGGRSMGGRICSMVAAGADGEPVPPRVAGVALVSYPLHPPGKPDQLRVEHLADLTVPCLFVHGTRDPFGSPDELQRWTQTIPGPVTHVWIDGGGHALKGADRRVASAVADWLSTV